MRESANQLGPGQEPIKRVIYLVNHDVSERIVATRIAEGDGLSVRVCDTISEFRERFDPEEVSCLLLAVTTSDDGIKIQQELIETHGTVPLVFIAGQADVSTAVAAFRRGAVHFLQRPFQEDELLQGIRDAIQVALAVKEQDMAHGLISDLTDRERQVLELIVRGLSTKEIATEIFRSAKTIEAHRRSIMRKLNASNLAEMVRVAMSARRPLQRPGWPTIATTSGIRPG